MKNTHKYERNYHLPPNWGTDSLHFLKSKQPLVEKPPVWCSVDLRDGNQALVVPMSLAQKLKFFSFLVKLGFKEIEVGFPAACDTEYEFCRALIEGDLIPDDVTIQVLTQSREPIIRRTFEALRGAKSAIVHFYNSTSVVQREQVFKKSKQEIIDIAIEGAALVKRFADEYDGNFRFQYSPESFTSTEPEFALEICNKVLEVLRPSPSNKVIINLPGTVEVSMPHVYAAQVEYMSCNLQNRESVIVSLHPHNDRGCAVAAAEMGLLAGADRVEGTLFGNGERTGNVCLITLALNMFSQGVEPELELNDIPSVVETYEVLTGMDVHHRHPYCGELVFAAFSGSHQDAIAKSMAFRAEKAEEPDAASLWSVPYLPVDPADLGREYENDVIRINSQSGKGGVGYILRRFGVDLPAKMRESIGFAVKALSDKLQKELSPDEVFNVFIGEFVNIETRLEVINTDYNKEDRKTVVTVRYNGEIHEIFGFGNGQLDALSDALQKGLKLRFILSGFSQHAMEVGSQSQAMSYVKITDSKGRDYWGAGLHNDIGKSARAALVSAINRSERL